MLLVALGCISVMVAQERVTRVVTIKNRNLDAINHTLHGLLGGTHLAISSDSEHIVLSGSKEEVDAFEAVIRQLDVPPSPAPNIQTNVYMIVASQGTASGTLPAELDPVVTQLKSLFPYKGYRLLDSFILRSRSGESAEASGFVASAQSVSSAMIYQARFNRASVDVGDKVRFNGLKLGLRVPVTVADKTTSYIDVGINTDVDVPEGKKVVVGKTSAVEGPDSALILVISAKVVD
jgi:hypothetical protein